MKRFLALAALLVPATVAAHPLAPAMLELREVGAARYELLWRTSVMRTGRNEVTPALPPDCAALRPPETRVEQGEAVVTRGLVQCAQPLLGREIGVRGLEGAGINVIARVVSADGEEAKALLGPDQASFTAVPAPVFAPYVALGASHLAAGPDHWLFLLALSLLLRGVRTLVLAVTAFTIGHSLTLALAALRLVPAGGAWAEVAIAVTLLVLALELARPAAAPASWLLRRPWLAAGAFGLVHGLGFAGSLVEAGLPANAVPLALLAFNLGIELGQLAFIAAAVLIMAIGRRLPARGPLLAHAPAYAIGGLAVYWCLERSAALF